MMEVPEDRFVDHRVKFYNAVAGSLPIGSFLTEYVIDKIPGQRMERLNEFIMELNERVKKLENQSFTEEPEYHALVEHVVLDATQPISPQRQQWLASLATPNATTDDMELIFRRKCANILSDLSDSDVEYLISRRNHQTRLDYQDQNSNRRYFISEAGTDENQNKLSEEEIFKRELWNEKHEITVQSLLKVGLIESERYSDGKLMGDLSSTGNLFLYVILGGSTKKSAATASALELNTE